MLVRYAYPEEVCISPAETEKSAGRLVGYSNY